MLTCAMLARQANQLLQWQLLGHAWPGAAASAHLAISHLTTLERDASFAGVRPATSALDVTRQAALLGPEAYVDSFKSPAQSLDFARGEVVYPSQLEGNVVGRALLTIIGAYGRKQQLRNGAALLYSAISEAAERRDLQQAVGLNPDTFMTTHMMLSLHLWLIINRLHEEGQSNRDVKPFQQYLYSDYFFKDVERRVYSHGVTMHVNKWMKKLEQQFYGSCMAYDMALRQEGGAAVRQAAFVDALVKNMYDAEDHRRPWAQLLERYLSRERDCLQVTDAEVIMKGQIRFSADFVTKK